MTKVLCPGPFKLAARGRPGDIGLADSEAGAGPDRGNLAQAARPAPGAPDCARSVPRH